MNLSEILETSRKPSLFAKGTASMWGDPHISNFLLEAHMNQDTDLASRKKAAILKIVDWIMSQVNQERMAILDLGCGPGLYAETFAERGHKVTGVDLSERSIRYAKNNAIIKGLDVEYYQMNYLELNMKEKVDLVILIYLDFAVLSPKERDVLLRNVYKALKPGGAFVFDALNEKMLARKEFTKQWEISEEGFWKNKPYLCLSEAFNYPEQKVVLDQYIVIDEDNNHNIYRFWNQYFDPSELRLLLGETGFSEVIKNENLLTQDDLGNGEDVTFYLARKE